MGPISIADRVFLVADRIAAVRPRRHAWSDLASAARLPSWCRPEHLAARALLRRILAEVAGATVAHAPLAATRRGQPYLVGSPEVAVSLSHTMGWAAAAVRLGGGSVGIDVQAPVPGSDGLARRCATPAGRAVLARLTQAARDTEVAWIWSVQEACVKALGVGLAGRPWTIPVAPGQRTGRWDGLAWTALRTTFPLPVSCAYGPQEVPR